MARNSSIEWTDHTFNPWWGCTRVSPACDHCYAEAFARRLGMPIWGKEAPRRVFDDRHWAQPLVWNSEAEAARRRHRVFCASMADVFEAVSELNSERERLWKLIKKTPWLDWLLLTKRPGAAARLTPWGDDWPRNVWLGTTIENATWAKKRMRLLLRSPAAVRFVSCEPLLGLIDLSVHLGRGIDQLNWVIVGGESGGHARPMDPAWVRSIRDQCGAGQVPFHFKQWGDWRPVVDARRKCLLVGETEMQRVGKKVAGRTLDGRTWDGLPIPCFGRTEGP